jgi:hypothetical protein
MKMVFRKTLIRACHSRSFQVQTALPFGWEASEPADHAVVRHHIYSDWHHVERALLHFRQQIADLLAAGWQEA